VGLGAPQFDSDRNGGNSQAILIVALVGVVVLVILAGLWVLAYFQFT
jgi:hypothetical protein